MKGSVYFLRPIGAAGPIKIGCSADPEGRLRTYMSWSPMPLEIVARIDGDQKLERRFHARFAAHHLHGEWFCNSEDLAAVIEAVSGGCFDVSSLPAPAGLGNAKTGWPAEVRSAVAHKSLASRAMYESHIHFPPAVRAAYDSIPSVRGAELAAAVAILRAFAKDPHSHAAQAAA